MNKSLKVLAISLICIFFIFSTSSFAANIEMNLTSNLVDSNITNTYNDTASNSTNNTNSTGSTNSTNTTTNTEAASTTNRNTSISDTLQALPESELGLTNILNILLIAVGVVLILLSIAIFIRLKK